MAKSLNFCPFEEIPSFSGDSCSKERPANDIQQQPNIDNQQYCSVAEAKSTLTNTNKFWLFHANIRSLQKNFQGMCQLFNDISFVPNIIALSELWVKDNYFFQPHLPDYKFIFSKSESRAGGVAFFIRDSYRFNIRNDLHFECANCENLWVKVFLSETRYTTFGVVYRHPCYNISTFSNTFQGTLFKLNRTKKHYFITGDFNIDYSKETNASYFEDISCLGCK